jgi:outer membrane lipoprotein SlyB
MCTPAVPSKRAVLGSGRSHAAFALAIAAALGLSACAVPVTRSTRIYDAPEVAYAPAPLPAVRYGSVQRIEVIETTQQPSGGGAVIGALVGGVVGNQFGHGAGRAAVTALGAFGGAVVGNQAEQAQAAANSSRYYRVFVQFDDGGRHYFDYAELNGLRSGERVRLEHGVLERG